MSNRTPRDVRIRVVYARPDGVLEKTLRLPRGTTVIEAVRDSGVLASIPKRHRSPLKLGVFGKTVGEHHMLEDGDRVEIYRSLLADPKEVRRRLAREGKVMGQAGNKSTSRRNDQDG